MAQTIPSEWRTNFFGVFGDSRVLCASILCPALSYYASSELFENPPAGVVESCVGGYCICFGFMIRSRLRYKYNLDGSILGDFLAHCCCQCLALARVWREAEFQVRAEKERTQWPPNTIPLPMSNPPAMTSVPLQISPQNMQHVLYYPPYQQQQMIPPSHIQQVVYGQPNTIDTNLSEYDSRMGVQPGRNDTGSISRHDSWDPPPSNNDPDPWSMIKAQGQTQGMDVISRPMGYPPQPMVKPQRQSRPGQQTIQESNLHLDLPGDSKNLEPETTDLSPKSTRRDFADRLAKLKPPAGDDAASSSGAVANPVIGNTNRNLDQRRTTEQTIDGISQEDAALPSHEQSGSLPSKDATFGSEWPSTQF